MCIRDSLYCYKTSGFLIFAVLLQRERTKYANGVDSKINVHTKFEVSVFMRCRVIQRVQKFKSRSRDTAVYYYTFTVILRYLLSICAPNLKLVATAVARIEEVKM